MLAAVWVNLAVPQMVAAQTLDEDARNVACYRISDSVTAGPIVDKTGCTRRTSAGERNFYGPFWWLNAGSNLAGGGLFTVSSLPTVASHEQTPERVVETPVNAVIGSLPPSAGGHAVAIGSGGTNSATAVIAGASGATAIGGNATAGAQALAADTVAIGQSVASGVGAVAIGRGSTAAGAGSVAIGVGQNVSGAGAVAIGDPSTVIGTGAVGMGATATATGNGAIAAGDTSTANGTGTISMGETNTATGSGSVALGQTAVANASGGGAVALGSNVTADTTGGGATGNIAIGSSVTNSNLGNSTAIGSNIGVSSNDVVALGGDFRVDNSSNGAIFFGNNSSASLYNLTTSPASVSIITNGNGTAISNSARAVTIDTTAASHATYAGDTGTLIVRTTSPDGTGNTPTGISNATNSVIINGTGAGAAVTDVISIGRNSLASANLATAIGTSVTASGTGATAIGGNATAGALAAGADSVAIGQASAAGNAGIAIGQGTTASQTDSIAIGGNDSGGSGASASSGAVAGIAIGRIADVGSGATNGMALGVAAQVGAGATNAFAIGTGATASAASSGAIGELAQATAGDASAFGFKAAATGTGATALGGNATAGATASAVDSIAVGGQSTASNTEAVAIGRLSAATGADAIAIGQTATAAGTQSIAIGFQNNVTGNHSVAIGDPNTVSGSNALVLANNSTVAGDNTVTVGNNLTNAANNSFVIGNNASTATGTTGSIVIGDGAATRSTVSNGTVIGSGASTTLANSVALGSGSTASAVSATTNWTGAGTVVGGQTFTVTQAPTNGVVAIGARQIQGVADGEVSSTSTDAINGSQLYAVAQVVGTGATNGAALGNSVATALGGGATYSAAGGVSAPSYSVYGTAQSNVGNAVAALQNRAPLQYSSTSAPTAGLGATGTPTTNDVTLVGPTAGSAVLLHNVAAGAASTDAVNIGQLSGVVTALGGGAAVNPTTGAITGPTYSVATVGPTGALGSAATANTAGAAFNVLSTDVTNLANKLSTVRGATNSYFHANSTGADSQAIGTNSVAVGPNSVANNAGDVAIGAGSVTGSTQATNSAVIGGLTYGGFAGAGPGVVSTVSVGAAGAERTISNVAAGRVTAASTDAVNGSQLYSTNTVVSALGNAVNKLGATTAGAMGGGAAFDPTTGTVSAPSYTVAGTSYHNTGSAIAAIDATLQQMSAGSGIVTQNSSGEIAVGANTGGNVVSVAGAAGIRRVTGLAAGAVAANSTDAINGAQLFQVQNSLSAGLATVRHNSYGAAASAMAQSGIPQAYEAGKSMVALGVGSIGGESAVALGASRISETGRWVMKLNGSVSTTSRAGASAGLGYQW